MSWVETPAVEIYVHPGPLNITVNLTQLRIDEYYLFFNSSQSVSLYTKLNECYECPFKYAENIPSYLSEKTLNSKWPALWQIRDVDKIICEFTPNVAEFGVYELGISENSCFLNTLVEPVNIYLPILTTILIFLAISICAFGAKYIYNKIYKRQIHENPEEPKKARVQSLDTFRGISIVLMILVNYGGGQYNFLDHAVWNGLTVADVVFPWFLWIMGVCIPISIKSALRREENYIFWNILRRSCILFMLGLSLNGVAILDNLRIFGVLQRFGICYFIVASLNLVLTKYKIIKYKNKLFQHFLELIEQWVIILVILVIHLACVFALEVPNCPKGYVGPGGAHHYGNYVNCTGGATGYIDRQILGEKHLYQHPTAREVYGSLPFDPEGPFGLLTSIVQVFLGVQAGTILQVHKGHKGRIIRWTIWGVCAGLIGGALCGFSREDGLIPVNKNLWSLSFVLVTSCFAFLLLTFLYVIIDVKKYWNGKPFIFAGMNATIMYVGHSLTHGKFPFQWGLLEINYHFQFLVQAVFGTTLWVIIAFWLFKIKFFLSL